MSDVYIVKEGDNLSQILEREIGDGSYETYMEIAKNNNIENPDQIFVGQKIDLSSVDNKSNQISQSTTNNSSPSMSSAQTSEKGIIIDADFEKKMLSELNLGEENKTTTTIKNNNMDLENSSNARKESKKNQTLKEEMKKGEQSKENNVNTNKTAIDNNIQKQTLQTQDSKQTEINQSNYLVPLGTLFEVCFPSVIKGFKPRNDYFFFVVKENAGEEFVNVNNYVKKCCDDLNEIITDLGHLKNDMGENTGTLTEIDNVIKGINIRKEELIQKNKELISACEEVIQYIYENKTSKADEAAKIANTISQIKL